MDTMVVWQNLQFIDWCSQGCPNTNISNNVKTLNLNLNGIHNITSDIFNNLTLLGSLIELNWLCGTDIFHILKCSNEVLLRPGFKLSVAWGTAAYLKWKEKGSDAKLASMVTALQLYDIEEDDIQLHKFVNLKNLHLQCGISTIPEEIYKMDKLEYFNVSDNEIEEISPKINKLVNLREFYCDGNKISSLPVEICDLRQLETFDYVNNTFDVLNPDIIEFMQTINKPDRHQRVGPSFH